LNIIHPREAKSGKFSSSSKFLRQFTLVEERTLLLKKIILEASRHHQEVIIINNNNTMKGFKVISFILESRNTLEEIYLHQEEILYHLYFHLIQGGGKWKKHLLK